MHARTATMRGNCQRETLQLNYPLIGALVLLGVYVALLFGAAVDYAASIDALALASAGRF